MITFLKQQLRKKRRERLTLYSNTAYQKLSGDRFLHKVPQELNKLWYDPSELSFMTLSLAYDSEIDSMSKKDLIHWIENEELLITRLQDTFTKIKKKKENR